MTITTEYSYLNHYALQGYAILSANVIGMYKALVFAQSIDQDFDFFIVFEDDAMPFANTSWPTKANADWNDLDQMLDEVEAENGGGLFLGCHHVESFDRDRLIDNNGKINSSISSLTHAWGAYAWVISRRHLPSLQKEYADVLRQKKDRTGTPDNNNHFFFQTRKIKEFVSVPLLVDHQSCGDSLTWKGAKVPIKRAWEGRRDWWNCQDICTSEAKQS